jgi:hypothetical protein
MDTTEGYEIVPASVMQALLHVYELADDLAGMVPEEENTVIDAHLQRDVQNELNEWQTAYLRALVENDMAERPHLRPEYHGDREQLFAALERLAT